MSLLANSNAIESGGYPIQRSLRFRSSASAYLNRTPAAAGNRKTWTWSGWVKRGTLGTSNRIFAADDGSASTDQDYNILFFTSSDKIQFSGGLTNFRITTSVYRDPSAWYHIVFITDTTQATAGNRFKLYVNGTEVTAFDTSNNPTQNTDLAVNAAIGHYHGAIATPTVNYFDGYLAEVNFIDGQALTPSSFGYTEPVTGVWQPLKYTGTYGTNGFYLPFSDNTSATTLSYDKSGNGNNWTPNNISTTAGATYDSMTDVPTLTSATAANYGVLNAISPIPSGGVISNGNLTFTSPNADGICVGTFGMSSGKWYWEVTATTVNAALSYIGILGVPPASITVDLSTPSNGYCYLSNGNKGNNNSRVAYGASFTSGDVIGVALDMDAGTLVFYKNNASQGTAYSGLSGTFTAALSDGSGVSGNAVFDCNFGQRPFSYTPPTGFVALNAYNLPTPTILKGSANMNAVLQLGSAVNTGANLFAQSGYTYGLAWGKDRAAVNNHQLVDTVRGTSNVLQSNTNAAETTYTAPTGTDNCVAWVWNAGSASASNTSGSITSTVSANTAAGFSIVSYNGTGAAATIGHGLGAVPSLIITHKRSSGGTANRNWPVRHKSVTDTFGLNECLFLNLTNARATQAQIYTTAPTSTVYSVGTDNEVNENTYAYIAYCFAEVAGFSKFGSYDGNGSTDGVFVYTGFRPAYVMTKCSSTTGDWRIYDLSRPGYNVIGGTLLADTSGAETTTAEIDLLSNGFKFRIATDPNSAQTFIYAAFSQNPFKYSNAR